jgi:NAD(P)-dependent dehydrogenase (short-subunit alcohol dehydrogenase family)
MRKVAIVTGGSSGIGFYTAKSLFEKGVVVYELSRRDCVESGVIHIKADVTKESDVILAVKTVFEKEGRIDILVNNAGMGISGAVEFTDTEDAQKIFDVNFFGMVRLCKAVIPLMRKNGGGRIINIGSVAGAISIPFQTFYSASKAAIHSYSMALCNELKPFGISVCAIMPGDIKTAFTHAREKNHFGDDVYNGRISHSVCVMEKDEQNGMSPAIIGNHIAKLALKKRVKVLSSFGLGYKCICVLGKLLPCDFVNFLVRMLYAR